jgi:hypothetical protein
VAIAWLTLWLGACARETTLSADPAIATRQVNQLIPRGTSESRAMKVLSARGFQLSRPSTDQALNHLIIGSYARDDWYWQVGVVIVDAKVAATSVRISDTRAPPQ